MVKHEYNISLHRALCTKQCGTNPLCLKCNESHGRRSKRSLRGSQACPMIQLLCYSLFGVCCMPLHTSSTSSLYLYMCAMRELLLNSFDSDARRRRHYAPSHRRISIYLFQSAGRKHFLQSNTTLLPLGAGAVIWFSLMRLIYILMIPACSVCIPCGTWWLEKRMREGKRFISHFRQMSRTFYATNFFALFEKVDFWELHYWAKKKLIANLFFTRVTSDPYSRLHPPFHLNN